MWLVIASNLNSLTLSKTMKKISSYWQSPAIPVQIFTPVPLVPLALHVQQSAIQNSSNDITLTNTVDRLSLQLCSKTKVNFEWLKYNSEVLPNTKQTKMNQNGIIQKKIFRAHELLLSKSSN